MPRPEPEVSFRAGIFNLSAKGVEGVALVRKPILILSMALGCVLVILAIQSDRLNGAWLMIKSYWS